MPQRLRPPVLRETVLPRSDLVGRLRSGDSTLVVVRAGAGYGKTTLMAQWIEQDPRRTAWVGLDPSDNDPLVLLRHVVRSLGSAGIDLDAVELLLADREPQLTRQVLPALATALDGSAEPFLLVLDDVHLLTGPEAVGVLGRIIDLATPGSTVALSGRSVPPVRLPRRELDGAGVELREPALAFTDTEAGALVELQLPDLPRSAAEQLVRRTDHWPAGLALGILALRDHPDPPVLLDGLLASDRRLAEYLHEEVLGSATPETREFLLRVAVLDRLSGDLCDEVLERTDSRQMLQQLVDSGNLFVVGVDADPDGFRLHHLVAELLVAQLRRQDPDEERRLRRRAAECLDRRGESDPAVRQALASGDADFASSILFRQVAPAFARGQSASLEQWVGSFPAQRLHQDGLLALAAAWAAVLHGRQEELQRYVALARTRPTQEPLPDGTASFELAIATIEMVAGADGVKGCAANAELVRAVGPSGSPWWPLAVTVGAICRSLSGDSDPVAVLGDAEIDTRGAPAMHAVVVAQLAIAHLRRGDRERGLDLARRAVDEMHAAGLDRYSMMAMAHAAAAWAAALRGDPAGSSAAARRVAEFVAAMPTVIPRSMIQLHLVLAEAALCRRDHDEARRCMGVALDALPGEPDALVLREWADDLESRVEALRGRPDLIGLTAAEERVLQQLVTHRSLGEIGDHLYVSRNTVKTHTLSIYRKLGVSGRSEAVRRAAELGLVEPAAS